MCLYSGLGSVDLINANLEPGARVVKPKFFLVLSFCLLIALFGADLEY
jgi:hypothetical protein